MREIFQWFFDFVSAFFVLYLIGYSTFLFLAVAVGSSTLYSHRRRARLKNELLDDYYVPVSIIVPAHNEAVTVVSTVQSLMALEYKLFEIIVVDDGSTDDTARRVIDAFRLRRVARPIRMQTPCRREEAVFENLTGKVPITLICKMNGGKADALNMGINAAKYPYFICMDADSVLQHDSLEKIVRPVLENDNVVAVGGAVRPCNGTQIADGHVVSQRLPKNILACMQALEYDRSFLAARILFDKFNGSIIISGAFGLFKKDVVIAAGGYDCDTMGEDMELVVKLHVYCRKNEIPYLIKYAIDAVCWSQAPETFDDLRKQRRRWHIGLFQCMTKHRAMLANPKYGLVGLISYCYFLLYELLSPYIEIFGILTIALAFVVDLINLPFMLLFFLIYAVYSSALSLTAFFARIHTVSMKLSAADVAKAILLCFFEVSFLRFFLAWVRATALFGYKKKKAHWGSIARKEIDFH